MGESTRGGKGRGKEREERRGKGGEGGRKGWTLGHAYIYERRTGMKGSLHMQGVYVLFTLLVMRIFWEVVMFHSILLLHDQTNTLPKMGQ